MPNYRAFANNRLTFIFKNMEQAIQTVLAYHHRTKHRLERYAKGPETIDWEDQPDPFRCFSGCAVINLPKPGRELDTLFMDLDTPEKIVPLPLDAPNIGLLLELAFGLSAWKQYGPSRWALRCNPSSGNLHPTEAYLVCTGESLFEPGVYHYHSHDHALEQRCRFTESGDENLLLGLSSIHWREAWKYGERAFRYCQHDIGHALAALHYAAACLGWSIELLADVADAELAALLGLDRISDFKKNEQETPDLLCKIHYSPGSPEFPRAGHLEQIPSATWFGKADSLRAQHMYHWPVIDEVADAAVKPRSKAPRPNTVIPHPLPLSCLARATRIIRQRRSAQQFDGNTPPLPSAQFYRMLSAVLPHSPALAFWPWPAKVHLFLFVHRVDGLSPGLYALIRDESALPRLKAATSSDFFWQPQTEGLPFYHLYSGDVRSIAKTLSCHQPIAGDSAFSLGMVADFKATVESAPWRYRPLFWECGAIGQVLYLEAEAAGVRGTGIGCFFDDSVHQILGITDDAWQSLYHFTIGKPLEDSRLQTLPPYQHLQ